MYITDITSFEETEWCLKASHSFNEFRHTVPCYTCQAFLASLTPIVLVKVSNSFRKEIEINFSSRKESTAEVLHRQEKRKGALETHSFINFSPKICSH